MELNEKFDLNVCREVIEISDCFRVILNDSTEMTIDSEQHVNSEPFKFLGVQFCVSVEIPRRNKPNNGAAVFKLMLNIDSYDWSFYIYCVKFVLKPIVASCQHPPEFNCECVRGNIISATKRNSLYKGFHGKWQPILIDSKWSSTSKEKVGGEFYCIISVKHLCDITFSPARTSLQLIDRYEIDKTDVTLIIDCKKHSDDDDDDDDDDNRLCQFRIPKRDICRACKHVNDLLTNGQNTTNEINLSEKHYPKEAFIDLMMVLLPPFMSLSFFFDDWERLEFFCYFANKYRCYDMQMRLTDYLLKEFENVTLITLADRYNMTRMLCSAVCLTNKSDLMKALTSNDASKWSDSCKVLVLNRLHHILKPGIGDGREKILSNII